MRFRDGSVPVTDPSSQMFRARGCALAITGDRRLVQVGSVERRDARSGVLLAGAVVVDVHGETTRRSGTLVSGRPFRLCKVSDRANSTITGTFPAERGVPVSSAEPAPYAAR